MFEASIQEEVLKVQLEARKDGKDISTEASVNAAVAGSEWLQRFFFQINFETEEFVCCKMLPFKYILNTHLCFKTCLEDGGQLWFLFLPVNGRGIWGQSLAFCWWLIPHFLR